MPLPQPRFNRSRYGRVALRAAALMLALAVSACMVQTQPPVGRPQFTRHGGATAHVLLMPPDVELSVLTASGLEEPKADWTALGERNVVAALRQKLAESNARMRRYQTPRDLKRELADVQLMKLHGAVGASILVHGYAPGPGTFLPTKTGSFDWTLGPGVRRLAGRKQADYALFLFLRDSYATGGRKALMIGAGLLGVGVSGGSQVGFASLVDMKSGDVVWFNVLARGTGDLRTAEAAREAVDALLAGFPL